MGDDVARNREGAAIAHHAAEQRLGFACRRPAARWCLAVGAGDQGNHAAIRAVGQVAARGLAELRAGRAGGDFLAQRGNKRPGAEQLLASLVVRRCGH